MLPGKSWIPQGPRSEISFRCVCGTVRPGGSRYKRWGPSPSLQGTCPGLGMGAALGSLATPTSQRVSNLVPGGPGARGPGGSPHPPPGVSAIIESQNTKTH